MCRTWYTQIWSKLTKIWSKMIKFWQKLTIFVQNPENLDKNWKFLIKGTRIATCLRHAQISCHFWHINLHKSNIFCVKNTIVFSIQNMRVEHNKYFIRIWNNTGCPAPADALPPGHTSNVYKWSVNYKPDKIPAASCLEKYKKASQLIKLIL